MPIVSVNEQCVDLHTLTVDDLVGRYKAHDRRVKLSKGDGKQDEYLMFMCDQWQAMTAKEKKNNGASGRGSK